MNRLPLLCRLVAVVLALSGQHYYTSAFSLSNISYLDSLSSSSSSSSSSPLIEDAATDHASSAAALVVGPSVVVVGGIDEDDEQEGLVPMDLAEVADETPSDHYAKTNPGAGWAGYQHPRFGGYLNHL